jgi:hypothetical protein
MFSSIVCKTKQIKMSHVVKYSGSLFGCLWKNSIHEAFWEECVKRVSVKTYSVIVHLNWHSLCYNITAPKLCIKWFICTIKLHFKLYFSVILTSSWIQDNKCFHTKMGDKSHFSLEPYLTTSSTFTYFAVSFFFWPICSLTHSLNIN